MTRRQRYSPLSPYPPLSRSGLFFPAISSPPNRTLSFAGLSATRNPKSASSASSARTRAGTPMACPSSIPISIFGKSLSLPPAPPKGTSASSPSPAAPAMHWKKSTTPASKPTYAPPTKAFFAIASVVVLRPSGNRRKASLSSPFLPPFRDRPHPPNCLCSLPLTLLRLRQPRRLPLITIPTPSPCLSLRPFPPLRHPLITLHL